MTLLIAHLVLCAATIEPVASPAEVAWSKRSSGWTVGASGLELKITGPGKVVLEIRGPIDLKNQKVTMPLLGIFGIIIGVWGAWKWAITEFVPRADVLTKVEHVVILEALAEKYHQKTDEAQSVLYLATKIDEVRVENFKLHLSELTPDDAKTLEVLEKVVAKRKCMREKMLGIPADCST